MFAQGQHEKLLNLLNGEERRTLSDWLYQYWFFCFKTAKHWGKGPRTWTAELLKFNQYLFTAPSNLPATPQDVIYPSTLHNNDELTPPTDLCRWYIHAHEEDLESISDGDLDPEDNLDPDDDTFWPQWSPNKQQPSFQCHLRNALEHNDFSTTSATDLPVAIPAIAKAADEERSNELLLESLGFSIMSRNLDQIENVLRQLKDKNIDPSPLYPFHLATSFLDGSKSCCDVVYQLARWPHGINGVESRKTYLNEHGHTILDNLMITIIKSHTSAKPVVVDEDFKDVARFVGEEVDICGRWDADSLCIRQLYARGRISIPVNWKHKFCNTSIQAVCHCIEQLFDRMPQRLLLETPSRLYIRRCFGTGCGKKLQLQPLHSLVMTGYHLATQGMDGEDLFGILACALCLIFHGFNPSVRADVSVTALLSLDSFVECDHVELTAAELAEEIMAMPVFGIWNTKIKTGWIVLAGILHRCEAAHLKQVGKDGYNLESLGDCNCMRSAEQGRDAHFMGSTKPDDQLKEIHDMLDIRSPCFVEQRDLGALWSSVLAELLSYRRLKDGLGWTSQYFSMETLREQLEGGRDLAVGYTEHNLLKAHCACHSFGRDWPTMLFDAIDPDIANVYDVWERTRYGKEPRYRYLEDLPASSFSIVKSGEEM
ncbi:hypothetical protein AA0113_g3504 [Alternaria arborescens]|uniref:Clr5 domain-containing protein n=1 Tax=Alternaria arborescens TaxID=156630 RepID=A0A4V1X7K0_9PLEO|nr:hypothetical protein AA0113_g3504 [Alternaria arborescens]